MRKPTTSSIVTCAALAAVLALPVSAALAAAEKGTYAGKTEEEITKNLEQLGYEVRKIDDEDGYLEAYALSEGARFEIYVDPTTGKIVKIQEDD